MKRSNMARVNAFRNNLLLLPLFLGAMVIPVYASTDAGLEPAIYAAVESGESKPEELTPKPEELTPKPEELASETEIQVGNEAQAATQDVSVKRTSLDVLSSEILNILIPSFISAIGILATMLLAWIGKKAKIDISEKRMSQWQGIAQLAAGRAGEWGRNELKKVTEGKTIPGPDILEVGVNWGLEYGIAHGLPDIGRRKFEGLLESFLHFDRIENPKTEG